MSGKKSDMRGKRTIDKSVSDHKLDSEAVLKNKLRLASYCPKVPGQSWNHIGRDK